jgi:hypothetical protein
MSRILRRPMFRGGGTVDSYGKGITAPLVPGYMGGGQIGGGIIYGKPMADGRFGFEKPVLDLSMMPNSNVTSGLELLKRNKAIQEGNVPFTSYNIPRGVTQEKQGEKTIDDEKSKVVEKLDFSDMDYDLEPPTTDYEKIPKYIEDIDGDGIRDLNPKYLEEKNFFNEIFGGPFEKKGESFGKADKKGRVFEGDELMVGDPREPLPESGSKVVDSLENDRTNLENLEESTELSAKDAIAENQKLFAELLGADKARGQDIGDMLLRFSGSGGNTLGEKFQNYVRAESAAGPSRSEKIKQTAAGLAINDYVAGKRSDEQIQKLKEVESFRSKLSTDKFMVDPSKDSWKESLDKTVLKYGGKEGKANDVGIIAETIKYFEPGLTVFREDNVNPKKLDIGDLEIGITIITLKNGSKKIIKKTGEGEKDFVDLTSKYPV